MRTCLRCWGRGGLPGLPLRSGLPLLVIPPLLLALQLFVVGPRLPRAGRAGVEDQAGAVAFSVMSIEPKRSSRERGAPSWPQVPEEEAAESEDGERRDGGRAYEDENEVHSPQVSNIREV